jgi:hypothetical protein
VASRTVLREREGEVPSRYSPKVRRGPRPGAAFVMSLGSGLDLPRMCLVRRSTCRTASAAGTRGFEIRVCFA